MSSRALIAQAVSEASARDILFVKNGIYIESAITVNKSQPTSQSQDGVSVLPTRLRFLVSGQHIVTSSTKVEVPKELLSRETLNGWIISVLDGSPIGVDYLSMEDRENTNLYFTYKNDVEGEVQIPGTKVVPELSPFATLTAVITVTALIVDLTTKRSIVGKS